MIYEVRVCAHCKHVDRNTRVFEFEHLYVYKNKRMFHVFHKMITQRELQNLLSNFEENHLQLMHKYVVHRAYNMPFTTPAQLIDRDALFVPAGWDGQKKIDIIKVAERISGF